MYDLEGDHHAVEHCPPAKKTTRFYVRLAKQAAKRARILKRINFPLGAEAEYRVVAMLLRIARSTVS